MRDGRSHHLSLGITLWVTVIVPWKLCQIWQLSSRLAHPRVPSVPRETWPMVQAPHCVTCNHWLGHVDGPPTSAMGAQMVNLYGPSPPGSAGRIIYNQEEVHRSQYHGISDSTCALSLLSNQPWGISYASNGSPATSGNHIDAQMAQSAMMNNRWINTSGSSGDLMLVAMDMGFHMKWCWV